MSVEYFNNHVQCYDAHLNEQAVALIYLKGQTHYEFGHRTDEAKSKLLKSLQRDKIIETL